MKLHWGNILIIAFILFGGMIILLVIKSVNSNYDMVSKEYYKDELVYQKIIDATNRTLELKDSIRYHQNKNQMIITIPEEISQENVMADLQFYCAYDAKKDQVFNLHFQNGMSNPIHLKDVSPGFYTLKLKLNANGKEYYHEKDLTIQSN